MHAAKATVQRDDRAGSCEQQRLLQHRFRVFDQRAGRASRHQPTFGGVTAVGKALFECHKASGANGIDHRAASEPHDFQRRIEIAHRLGDASGERGIARGLVVERAVRLDVGKPPTSARTIASSAPTW